MDGHEGFRRLLLAQVYVVEPRTVSSLYSLSLIKLAENFDGIKIDLRSLPANIAFDLCDALFKSRDLCSLNLEICHLDVFDKLLKLTHLRSRFHTIFQGLEEHGTKLGHKLCSKFCSEVNVEMSNASASIQSKLHVIYLGLRLGTFLSDAAWYDKAQRVLRACKDVCETLPDSPMYKRLLLQICHHLLRVEAVFCNLEGAGVTFQTSQNLLSTLRSQGELPNLAAVYTNFSYYFYICNDFKLSYDYIMAGLKQLDDSLPPKTRLDALRQASKSCVVKRQFGPAGVLIEQALDLAKDVFGEDHPKYADTQLDYGFFLLNFDSIQDSVLAYETACKIKKRIFSNLNIHVAVTLEDLAYALYVYEYSSGSFDRAQTLAEEAITIMKKILPPEHIMLSSAQRVKALILEEIAIDLNPANSDQPLLKQAEQLHLSALRLGRKHFGERNVQTAKHYGNLGRLYQSMRLYDDAEKMHIKAIEIKEAILGPEDYEVGLSLGHLASLYNYHMQLYDKAILLYNRSIKISLKLFGPEYSGLEYDYRGLIHVYNTINDRDNANHYHDLLFDWRGRREQLRMAPKVRAASQPPQPIRDVVALVMACTPSPSDATTPDATTSHHYPSLPPEH